MNRSNDAKSSSTGKTKRPESANRSSLAKPLTALAVLVVAAASVAMFLVKRNGPESSPVAASSNRGVVGQTGDYSRGLVEGQSVRQDGVGRVWRFSMSVMCCRSSES